MRFFHTAAAALFATLALAQTSLNNAISIPEGQSTLEVTAGQPTTIVWTNPSSGDVTIKLQQSGSNITPDSGVILGTVPASAGTFTFTIQPEDVNSFQYTIEIIDNTNPDNYNFSPNFGIQGATGTSTGTASGASVTASATGSTATDSTATDSITSASDSTSTASTTETTASETSSSSQSSETTSAPSSSDNSGAGLRVQGGLVAALAVAVVVL